MQDVLGFFVFIAEPPFQHSLLGVYLYKFEENANYKMILIALHFKQLKRSLDNTLGLYFA